MLEELLALGHKGAEYDAWLIKIGEGEQFGSRLRRGQPELQDPGADRPQRAQADPRVRIRRDPAPPRREVRRLPADRAGGARRMPVVAVLADGQRALSRRRLRPLLRLRADQDRIRRSTASPWRRSASSTCSTGGWREQRYLAGDDYTIADIAVWPWYGGLAKGWLYGAGEFLAVHEYKNVQRWADAIGARPAVKRGRIVNRAAAAIRRASCTSATTPATSRPRRRTSWR